MLHYCVCDLLRKGPYMRLTSPFGSACHAKTMLQSSSCEGDKYVKDFMWLSTMHLELIHYACGSYIPSSTTNHKILTHLLVAIVSVVIHPFLLCNELLLHKFSTK
jgi:hypothetical protein